MVSHINVSLSPGISTSPSWTHPLAHRQAPSARLGSIQQAQMNRAIDDDHMGLFTNGLKRGIYHYNI